MTLVLLDLINIDGLYKKAIRNNKSRTLDKAAFQIPNMYLDAVRTDWLTFFPNLIQTNFLKFSLYQMSFLMYLFKYITKM